MPQARLLGIQDGFWGDSCFNALNPFLIRSPRPEWLASKLHLLTHRRNRVRAWAPAGPFLPVLRIHGRHVWGSRPGEHSEGVDVRADLPRRGA